MIIVHNDDGLEITIGFNDQSLDALEIVKSLPNIKFIKRHRVWQVPTYNLLSLEDRLKRAGIRYKVINNTTKLNNGADFNFKLEPFPYQKDGFEYGKQTFGYILADDPGLGKSKQLIDIATYKKSAYGYKHCLIIPCVKELSTNWVREIQKNSDELACIIGEGINGRYINENGKRVKSELYDRLTHLERIPDEYFWILNIESLRFGPIKELLRKYIKRGVISMVAIDEIHYLKSPTSQQGKGLLSLSDCKDKVCITGTPIENSPLDGYIPLKFLGQIKQTWTAFKDFYCEYGGYGGHQIIRYRNMDIYQRAFKNVMLRRKKEDVFDLPEKIIGNEYLDMNKKQRKLYEDVKLRIKADIDKILLSPNPLAAYTRLRQATAHTSILSTTVSESVKFERLYSKLEDINEKFIVFSSWAEVTEMLYKFLKKFNPVMVNGNVDPKVRQCEIDIFQNDDKCKVILGTYRTLGVGYNLTAARRVEHFDNPWSMSTKNQANDRAHRIGTTGVININTMLCRDTIDERIDELIENKGAICDFIIDGRIVGDRKKLLEFLLS